jgi:integrase/recombinase XerD
MIDNDRPADQLPTPVIPDDRRLTAAEFHGLADLPSEIEWFANITNLGTRRIYKIAIQDFMRFTGISRPEEFRIVTWAHVIAWRDDLERRELDGATRRNRLAPLRRCSNISVKKCGQPQSGQRREAAEG